MWTIWDPANMDNIAAEKKVRYLGHETPAGIFILIMLISIPF